MKKIYLMIFFISSLQIMNAQKFTPDTSKSGNLFRASKFMKGFANGFYDSLPPITAVIPSTSGVSNIGAQIYNTSDKNVYLWDGITWNSLISNITASNGLTKVGNDVRLGGTLTGNTNILFNNHNLTFNSSTTGINEFYPSYTAITHYNLGLFAARSVVNRSQAALITWYTDSANLNQTYTRGCTFANFDRAFMGFNYPISLTPYPLLEYQDSTSFYLALKDTSVVYAKKIFFNGRVGNANVIKASFDSIGRFGINTTLPQQRLHVKGQVQIDTLLTGVNTDSISVIHNGVFKKILPTDVLIWRSNVSAAATLSLNSSFSDYIFSGTTTTWTLPVISGNTNVKFFIKNRGSGDITLNSNGGGNDIYNNAPANSVTIGTGTSVIVFNDGTYWNIE